MGTNNRPGPANAWPSRENCRVAVGSRVANTAPRPWPMNWCSLKANARPPSSRSNSPPRVSNSRKRSRQMSGVAAVVSANRPAAPVRVRGTRRRKRPPSSGSTSNSPSDQRASGWRRNSGNAVGNGAVRDAASSSRVGEPPWVKGSSVSSMTWASVIGRPKTCEAKPATVSRRCKGVASRLATAIGVQLVEDEGTPRPPQRG